MSIGELEMSLSKSDKDFVTRVGEWRELDAALASRQRRINELEAMLKFLVSNDSINDSSIEKEVVALLNR